MDAEEMQRLIDGGAAPENMVAVARGYLDGAVLRDPVAAEAWLLRAIEADDAVQSPIAMGLLARRILGREEVICANDLRDIRSRLPAAVGQERQELMTLLELAADDEKLWPNSM